MITPTIMRRGSMGVSEGLPSLVEPYMAAPIEDALPNPDAVRRVAAVPGEPVAAVAAHPVGDAGPGSARVGGSRGESRCAPGRAGERAARDRADSEHVGLAAGHRWQRPRRRPRTAEACRGPASCSGAHEGAN